MLTPDKKKRRVLNLQIKMREHVRMKTLGGAEIKRNVMIIILLGPVKTSVSLALVLFLIFVMEDIQETPAGSGQEVDPANKGTSVAITILLKWQVT